MGFEPQKFFIGVIDLFSVLLPGAVLTFLLKGPLWRLLGYKPGSDEIVIFLVVSYLLGHFIFLIGSALLDDRIYDPVKGATFAEQVRRVAKGEKLSPTWARLLAKVFVKSDSAPPVSHAVKIKEYYLDRLKASLSINAFQWAKAQLTLDHPEALASVQRFEADSKFFRSLFVVLCIICPWSVVTRQYPLAIACLPLLVLAFWRYFDQRIKATNQAYWYVITLESQRKDGYRATATMPPSEFTHAGGVVYRRTSVDPSNGGTKDKLEYLLVQATDDPLKWVLPKGHINPGEKLQETAVREVREESGVWAGIRGPLGESSYTFKDEPIKVQFYLMEALKQERPKERKREHLWLILEEALKRNAVERHRKLLKLADEELMAATTSLSADI
ncbi:MAG: NUDIX domain-containing protein [Acidobacteriia bacterium]|nr:NUDIX domain-containing protein [Terriglobia bacterium]